MTRSLEVSNYWHTNTCQCDACLSSPSGGRGAVLNSINIDVLLQQGLKRLYDRKIAAGSNDAAFVKYNQEQLFDAVKSGWQGKIESLKYGSPQHELLLNLRHNTQVFSIFKVHDMCNEVHAALFDANGNLRTFAQFKKAAGPILKDYNANWLAAEYQTAQASARMAQKWKSITEKYGEDVMLTYKTIGDGRVRDEHALLDATTRPATDVFWNTYYPPNGFRCRCFVRASPGAAPVEPAGLPEVPKLFRINVGKTMTALPTDHPYYQVDVKKIGAVLATFSIFSMALDRQAIARNFSLFEKYLADPDIDIFPDNIFKESGGFVAIHKKYHLEDFDSNLKASRFLAEKEGDAILIREHSFVDEVSNPEFEFNGNLSDLKTAKKQETYATRHLQRMFEDASGKGCTHIVCDLSNYPDDVDFMADRLKNAFRNSSKITEAVIIMDENIFRVSRKMYDDRKLVEALKKMASTQ